jgi:hypothetical protein
MMAGYQVTLSRIIHETHHHSALTVVVVRGSRIIQAESIPESLLCFFYCVFFLLCVFSTVGLSGVGSESE